MNRSRLSSCDQSDKSPKCYTEKTRRVLVEKQEKIPGHYCLKSKTLSLKRTLNEGPVRENNSRTKVLSRNIISG